jgi:predicted ATPase/DNA-binding winged helix-turn-helix (wHTH) protein
LEVRHGERAVEPGGPRIRALLAMLLVHAREPVTADVLVQSLWGDEAPPSAAKALQVSVSRLRQALGPAADRLETVGRGYRLRVEPGELDAERFERMYESARALSAVEAAGALRGALALWRGPALADVRYEPWAQPEIRRLEELRAVAIEARIDAELALGEHARLVGELEALVAEHPLRERLRGQQMLALYRSGRHADALAAFRDARGVLDEQLGLEPGPELRRLEQQILAHDPALAAPDHAHVPAAPPTPTFGRDDDLRAVLAALTRTRLLTLTGPGGVGKTRLAIEAARAAGGCFVSLASTADADRIPGVVCDALGVARVPEESDEGALDRALARGPMLLILDNLEHLPDAAPLLARLIDRHPELTVLATSRHALRIRAERLFPVPPLAAAGAADLFVDRARARDPMFEPDPTAIADICERVGGLPLAIELAAARLGVLSPAELAERLGNELGVLDRGPQDAPERQRTLRATLDWSFELLDEQERRAFSALGAFAGGCDVEAAQAVTGSPLPVLEGLVDKSLVMARGGRLTLLEPVRQYAGERLAERSDAEAVRRRHLLHYLSVAQRCEEPVWVRHRSCPEFSTLRREHENLRAAITWGLASGEALRVVELVSAIAFYMWYAHDRAEQLRWCDRAFAAAGDDVPLALRARAEFAVGFCSSERGERFRHDLAALALFRELGDDTMVARCLVDLAMTARLDGDPARAAAYAGEAVEHARRVADDGLIGAALAELSGSTFGIEAAAPLARAAVTHLRAADAHELAAQVLSEVGILAALEDAHEMADQLGREAMEVAAAVGDVWTIAFVQGNAATAALLGDRHDAARAGFHDELVRAVTHALPHFTHFDALYGLAALAAAGGDDQRAAVVAGAAWAIDARPVDPAARPVYNRLEQRFLAPARERLGDDAWKAASAEGRRMDAGAAVAYALEPALLPD